MPSTGEHLFGRDAELAWLDACWNEGARVATIVAFGGIGKSTLVKAWLDQMDSAGWRGATRVYGWSFYSQGTDRLSSSDEFIDAALRWFGDPDPKQGSPWDKGVRLAELVRQERTLLVLDGIEPLQWGPGVQEGKLKDQALTALVKELASQNTGLCVITSRIKVTDLDGARGGKVMTKSLESLSAEDGARLLRALGATNPDEELQAAARDYRGHCLALTLLGSYVRKAHKGDVCKRPRLRKLEEHPARRMMATYERWFEGKPELAILRMLGLFDRPAGKDEIKALREEPPIPGLTDTLEDVVGGAWSEAVTTLQDVRLLGTDPDDRLDAHPLVREYFAEQLRTKQPEAWREGHRRLYEDLKKKAKELPETVEEMAPLYAAVVHGCLAGKKEEALYEVLWKRIERKNEFFNIRKLGALGSEVAILSAFFDPPWERLVPGLREYWQTWVLNEAGFALRALGRLLEAAGLMRLSLEQGIAQQHWKQAAISASNLSELLRNFGELSEAREQALKAVELADRSGDAFQRLVNRTTLAGALHAMGLLEGAAAQFEEAERMQKEREPSYPLLYSFRGFQYCDLLLEQGRDAEVRERAAQAQKIAEHNNWLLSTALGHLSLGRAHILGVQRGTGGDLAQASDHLRQAVDSLRRAGQQDYLPLGLLARAALHVHINAFPAAHRDLKEALDLDTRCGLRLHECDAHLGYARLHIAESNLEAAGDHLAKARRIIDETGYHRRDEELLALSSQHAQDLQAQRPPIKPPE